MHRILSLETSTSVCSVAVHQDGKLLSVAEIHEDQAHASKLALLIDYVLKLSTTETKALSAVAISSGPGSYTGLRIGASTAKGICFGHSIPLIAIDPLKAMAWRVIRQQRAHGVFCPLVDARRMEAYTALFDYELKNISPVNAVIIESNTFRETLDKDKVFFFGNAVDKCEQTIKHPNAIFIHNIYPSAADLGELAFDNFTQSKFEDLVHFEPLYLKEFSIRKSTKLENVLNK